MPGCEFATVQSTPCRSLAYRIPLSWAPRNMQNSICREWWVLSQRLESQRAQRGSQRPRRSRGSLGKFRLRRETCAPAVNQRANVSFSGRFGSPDVPLNETSGEGYRGPFLTKRLCNLRYISAFRYSREGQLDYRGRNVYPAYCSGIDFASNEPYRPIDLKFSCRTGSGGMAT